MNSKGLTIALGILVALGAGTAYVYRTPPSSESGDLSNPWPRLEGARVDHLTLHRPSAASGQQDLEFAKVNGAWRMTSPGQGPTEGRLVEEVIERLGEARVTRIAGRSAQSYETFGVDDGHAVKITLKNGATTVLELFVGESVDNGTVVRYPGRTETFQIDQSISFAVRREARDWRDREITHATAAQVNRVAWVNPAGSFTFTRSGDTWAAAEGTAVERLDLARVGNLVDTLVNLRASDFAGASDTVGFTDASPRVTLTLTSDAGPQTVTLRVGANHGDGESYLRREGNDVTFVVSRASSDAVNPQVTAFQQPVDAGAGDAGAAPAAPAAEAPPGGGGQPPGMAIPPEVMRQLQQQLQRAGAGGGGAAPH
ncbi:MAG: DUF4340 domain-containing protein [Myxococcales bacterium]|nr:DUF4340 domain-containing protein [Myxococcales bacterium]